jgi:hypothetical protein
MAKHASHASFAPKTKQNAKTKTQKQIVEQTKEIQATTLAALRDQGRQMQNVSAGMDRLGSDLSYSERMLKFMRRCCCVGLFCACCFEPTGKVEEDSEWRANGGGGGGGGGGEHGGGALPTTYKIAPPPPAIIALQQREARERAEQAKAAKRRGGKGAGAAAAAAAGGAAAAGPAASAYRGPSGSGLAAAGLEEQAGQVSDETARQNDYLDQISAGLDHLKQGAVAMNAELRRQEAHAQEMGDDAQQLHARLQSVNRKGFRGV